MKRIGIFTGKFYDENVDIHDIKECALLFSKEDEDDMIARAKINRILHCDGCFGCEASRNEEVK